MSADSLSCPLTVPLGVDDEKLSFLDAPWMLPATTNGIAWPGAVDPGDPASFEQELLAAGGAVFPECPDSPASSDDKIFVISHEVLTHPGNVAGVAGGNEVAGVVVQDVTINMVSDQAALARPGTDNPGYWNLAPVTRVSSEPDLAVQDIPVNEDGIVLDGQGMSGLLESCVSSGHHISNTFQRI